MPDAFSQSLRDWQTFYFLIGGAAASLAGLMFVAISLGTGTISQRNIHALRVFVSPTLIHFIYVLATALVLVIPTVTPARLGTLLVLVGLVSFGRSITMVSFMREQHRRQVIDYHDWVWYLVAPSVSYLAFVGTGAALLRGIGQAAFDGLALASILLLIAGIRNAWDFVTYLTLRQNEPPRPKGEDPSPTPSPPGRGEQVSR